ncbi:unnamed protein product [Calicophoron daubneyi]|uniref:Importin N-terminal domain-containing protein n=1 Tax=Calicophoron daubneyi TaxID=300641 RepID=A0AAV2T0Y9_CALDB
MEAQHVVDALRDTLVSEKQAVGAKNLNEMHKIIGFVPTLLNIVAEGSLEVGVRQAAALYLKNNISEWWEDPSEEKSPGDLSFSIHENDRQAIRSSIVPAIVAAPVPLREQLKVALSKIIKIDFPSRFAEFPDQIKQLLSSSDHNQWYGAFVCLHSFIKVYEYKKGDEKHQVSATMRVFVPVLYTALSNLVSDKSDDSLTTQVLILKIIYAYIHFHFPLDVMDKTCRLSQAFAWKILRPHFSLLVREVIFPLLSHSEEDEELWRDDPIEYIRYESCMYTRSPDVISLAEWGRPVDPPIAAFALLSEACLKRRGVLNNTMPFCIHVLTTDSSPAEKDAVLHMYGAVSEILLKKEAYKAS